MQTSRWDRGEGSSESLASVSGLGELCPSQAAPSLAASLEVSQPHDLDRSAELLQACAIAGNSIILTPAAIHTLQPLADLRQVVVSSER